MIEVKCCSRHEENVKLIWTFAFAGAEYWCPYCGANEGIMGAGEIRELTFEECREMVKYKHIGKEFLEAKSANACNSLIWEGERISPHDLPNAEKKRIWKVIEDWVYPINLI